MKTKDIKHTFVAFLCVAACVGFTACETDPIEMQSGKLPDKEPIENVHGKLRGAASTGNTIDILLTEGDGFATKGFYYQQSKPAATGFSLTAWIDNNLLGDYNAAEDVERQLLPEANYEFPDGKTLDLSADGQRSALKRIKFLASGLAAGEYVLPLTVAEEGTSDADKTLYYNVTIRQPQVGDTELHDGSDLFFVFYINTNQYDPRLVDDYFIDAGDWYHTIGNIINLRTVTLDYEAATGRALFNLGNDMRYVLDHVTTLIRPLQDKGRKVCLSIEGSGSGLGFCNLNDKQIADFTAQVKAVIETYELDGINLWDRNTGYGKEGMPAMNTTSYPKLIKALREALGDEKQLTVTVYEKPTESFYDVEASGGIAVGDYIDYAWSGYNETPAIWELLDPWHPELEFVSSYTQEPIANLDPSKFGCINFQTRIDTTQEPEFLIDWVEGGYQPNNIIVFSDLQTCLQDQYETLWDMNFSLACEFMDRASWIYFGERMYLFDKNKLSTHEGGYTNYNKWLKDW